MNAYIAPSHREFDHAARRFDKQMRATNACLSVLVLADDVEDVPELVEQVAALITGWITGRECNIRKLTRQIERQVDALRQTFAPAPSQPGADADDAGPATAVLDQLLVRLDHLTSADKFASLLLGNTAEDYRRGMNLLRHEDERAHEHIVAGRIGTALGRLNDQTPPSVACLIRQAAAMQARLLVALSAIDKAHALRSLAKRPLGDSHLATAPWPVVGRAFNETLVEPARLILALGQAGTSREAGRLAGSPELTFLYLRKKQLLPNAPVARIIFDIAKRVSELVPATDCGRAAIAPALNYAVRQADAFISKPGPQPEEWSRMSFVDFRLGLSTTEAATLLARNVLIAFHDIDARVHGRPKLPYVLPPEPVVTRVCLLAEVLRSVARTDPLASPDPNPVNKNGRAAYGTLMDKLRDPAVARRGSEVLGIDVDVWFAR